MTDANNWDDTQGKTCESDRNRRNTTPEATLASFRRHIPIWDALSPRPKRYRLPLFLARTSAKAPGHVGKRSTSPTPLHQSFLHSHRPRLCVKSRKNMTVWNKKHASRKEMKYQSRGIVRKWSLSMMRDSRDSCSGRDISFCAWSVIISTLHLLQSLASRSMAAQLHAKLQYERIIFMWKRPLPGG